MISLKYQQFSYVLMTTKLFLPMIQLEIKFTSNITQQITNKVSITNNMISVCINARHLIYMGHPSPITHLISQLVH